MTGLAFTVTEDTAELGPREELSQLSHLNTGLARYIETVRRLTAHNEKLVKVVTTLEESTSQESGQIHQVFQEQIGNMKREKEDFEKRLSQMKTEMDVLLMLNQDLKSRNCKMDRDLAERERLRRELLTKKQTLERSLEEAGFKKEGSERALSECEGNISSMQIKLDDIGEKVSQTEAENDNLEKKLLTRSSSIEEQRTQITETKEMIKEMEKEKLNPIVRNLLGSWHQNLELDPDTGCSSGDHERVWSQLSSLRQEENFKLSQLEENQLEAINLEKKIQKLMEEHENLMKMIEDMKKASDSMKILHEKKLSSKDEEMNQIEERLTGLEAEIEELLMIKQGLDAEIKIYKTLIDSEESRDTDEKSPEGKDLNSKYFSSSITIFSIPDSREGEGRTVSVLHFRQGGDGGLSEFLVSLDPPLSLLTQLKDKQNNNERRCYVIFIFLQ